MQCINPNFIYTIDKKLVEQDKNYIIEHNILNIKNLERIYGSWWNAVEQFFKSKEYVFFNRKPIESNNPTVIKLWQHGYFKYNQVGCGKCEICRTERSKEWAVKAYCEQKCWKNATFITFTYNPENLPKDRKLHRSDIQKFWKDLRYHLYKNTKKASKIDLTTERELLEEIPDNILEQIFGRRRKNRYPIRYINCGEYGPKTKRPHYHAVIYNFTPTDKRRLYRDRRGYWVYTSDKLSKIWGKGFITISDATASAAAYVARYCTKKMSRSNEENERMKRKKQIEFIGASSLGFIGYYWWIHNKDTVKQNFGILMKTKKGTHLAKVPKAMCKKWILEDPETYDTYDYWKNETGRKNWENILKNTKKTEKQYIWDTYIERMHKLQKLRRDAI